MEDIVIAGSGPAGLTAAIYTARANLAPLVFEGNSPGGQLTVSQEVENYPGFPKAVSGWDLMQNFREQAERFGARFAPGEIDSVARCDADFEIQAGEQHIISRSIIVATGAEARRLPIPNEAKYYGRGVSGCATCDGAFFRDKHVLVVGGGNTAMEDASFLTRFASKVTIVHRRDYFRADAIEISKVKANPKVEWMVPWTVEDILGNNVVESVLLRNTATGESHRMNCDGIFVAIGHDPKTNVFSNLVDLDESGFIKVIPGTTKTRIPGVFACGDVQDPAYKQAVVAAGFGCMAALDTQRYLETLNEGEPHVTDQS